MTPRAFSLRFLQTQPDARLVELSRAGSERAFEALIRRYRRALLRYSRTVAGSDGNAEDVVQQALLQAWLALSARGLEVRDVRAWLYRIVHNVAISDHRRRVHQTIEIERSGDAAGADDESERRAQVREALAGLASLPEMQRAVMLSAAVDGRSHDEIALAFGLSQGAVRGLMYRARAALRDAAAAITPLPVLHWVLRRPSSAGSTGVHEALAGGGGAGLGTLAIKGGALLAATGAIVTASGLTQMQPRRGHPARADGKIALHHRSGRHDAAGVAANGTVVAGVASAQSSGVVVARGRDVGLRKRAEAGTRREHHGSVGLSHRSDRVGSSGGGSHDGSDGRSVTSSDGHRSGPSGATSGQGDGGSGGDHNGPGNTAVGSIASDGGSGGSPDGGGRQSVSGGSASSGSTSGGGSGDGSGGQNSGGSQSDGGSSQGSASSTSGDGGSSGGG